MSVLLLLLVCRIAGSPLFTGETEIDQIFKIFSEWTRVRRILCALAQWLPRLRARLPRIRPPPPAPTHSPLARMAAVKLGTPTLEEWPLQATMKDYNERFPKFRPRAWQTLLPQLAACSGEDAANAIDLLSQMLVYDPPKRISAEEAMEHPFFAEIRDALAAASAAAAAAAAAGGGGGSGGGDAGAAAAAAAGDGGAAGGSRGGGGGAVAGGDAGGEASGGAGDDW